MDMAFEKNDGTNTYIFDTNPILPYQYDNEFKIRKNQRLLNGSYKEYTVTTKKKWSLVFEIVNDTQLNNLKTFWDLNDYFRFYPDKTNNPATYYDVVWINEYAPIQIISDWYNITIQLEEI